MIRKCWRIAAYTANNAPFGLRSLNRISGTWSSSQPSSKEKIRAFRIMTVKAARDGIFAARAKSRTVRSPKELRVVVNAGGIPAKQFPRFIATEFHITVGLARICGAFVKAASNPGSRIYSPRYTAIAVRGNPGTMPAPNMADSTRSAHGDSIRGALRSSLIRHHNAITLGPWKRRQTSQTPNGS